MIEPGWGRWPRNIRSRSRSCCFPSPPARRQPAEESLLDTLQAYDTGALAIKPFGGGGLFQAAGDRDLRARLAIRHILAHSAITAAVGGYASAAQLENAAAAGLAPLDPSGACLTRLRARPTSGLKRPGYAPGGTFRRTCLSRGSGFVMPALWVAASWADPATRSVRFAHGVPRRWPALPRSSMSPPNPHSGPSRGRSRKAVPGSLQSRDGRAGARWQRV